MARRLIAGDARTPFLAVDRATLRENVARWRRHLPGVAPYYAVKANIDPLVLRELFAAGADADVAAKRTVRAVEDYLGEFSTTFAPEECRNYFRSCGYPTATPTREPLQSGRRP